MHFGFEVLNWFWIICITFILYHLPKKIVEANSHYHCRRLFNFWSLDASYQLWNQMFSMFLASFSVNTQSVSIGDGTLLHLRKIWADDNQTKISTKQKQIVDALVFLWRHADFPCPRWSDDFACWRNHRVKNVLRQKTLHFGKINHPLRNDSYLIYEQ